MRSDRAVRKKIAWFAGGFIIEVVDLFIYFLYIYRPSLKKIHPNSSQQFRLLIVLYCFNDLARRLKMAAAREGIGVVMNRGLAFQVVVGIVGGNRNSCNLVKDLVTKFIL